MNSNLGSFDPTKYTKSKWLKGSDLQLGRAMAVTIAKAWEQYFEQTAENKVALAFDELDQQMALNKTQVMTMIELFGADPRAWVGQRVNLLAIPSNYQGKPTIQILAGETMPSFGGRSNGKPAGYSREDALQRQRPRPPSQSAAVADAPDWATQGPEDREDIPF